jgi:uncharacterized membrane protein
VSQPALEEENQQLTDNQRAHLAEARSDTARALFAMAAFTVLAYVDLRSKCVTTRLSWLWFLRAACVAFLKTLCYIAPLVAILIILPFVLLCNVLNVFEMHGFVRWLEVGPAAYVVRYGPCATRRCAERHRGRVCASAYGASCMALTRRRVRVLRFTQTCQCTL